VFFFFKTFIVKISSPNSRVNRFIAPDMADITSKPKDEEFHQPDEDFNNDDKGSESPMMNDDEDMKNNDELSSIPFTNEPFAKEADNEGWILITEDGGIKKKMLNGGTGLPPKKGADVFCHYVGTLVSNGEKFDSSRDRNEPFNFPIAQGRVIKGWDIGIATMKKGEKCILRCRHDYAYGENGQGSIPPKSDLDFEVELLDWSNWKRVNSKDDFQKQIIIEGEGDDYDNPREESKCIISYQLKLNDEHGIMFMNGDHVEFIVDDDDRYPQGFHDAIKDMKKKSQVEFKISSQYMFKDIGNEEYKIPPNSNIYANITLHDYTNPKATFEMTRDEKYNEAQKKRHKGMNCLKKNNMKDV